MKYTRGFWFLLVFCSTQAIGADKLRPGLWEMSMRSDAFKAMPKIPPEQLEKMKQMGIQIPGMQGDAMVHKVCFTKEMLDRNKDDLPPSVREHQECQPQNIQRSGNSFSADMACNGENMKGVGKTKGEYAEDHFNSVFDFKGTAQGRPIEQHVETRGRWLGAECGDVKPMPPPVRR